MQRPELKAQQAGNRAKPLVLVVDDMPIIREPISLCLCNAGYETAEAGSAAEAIKLVTSRKPDLVILDIHLGAVDGLALLSQIRSLPGLGELPAVLLTVEADARFVVRASKMGVRDYVLKSKFSVKELLSRVAKYLPLSDAAPAHPVAGGDIPRLSTREQTIERADHALKGRTLSGVVAQVITLAASPRASMADLGALIARDPMLSANVLRIANSSAYCSTHSVIANIPDAIRRIGCTAVGQIAASIAVIDCLPGDAAGGFNPIRAWQHSFAAAQLCQRLSPEPSATGGVAYLVGLCHDLTDILFHTHFTAECGQIAQAQQRTGLRRAEVERAMLGMTVAQLVPVVLSKIGLPQTIRDPIVEFHNAAAEPGRLPADELAARLWMAETYANGLLLASSPDSVIAPLSQAGCAKAAVAAQPALPDAAALRAQVFSLTAMLARLSPTQDASLAAQSVKRTGAKLWLARDPGLSNYDPIAAALDSLAEVEVHNRLPTSAELQHVHGVVAATCGTEGCKPIPAADIRGLAAAKDSRPLLWVTAMAPLPLSDLERFLQTVQSGSAALAA